MTGKKTDRYLADYNAGLSAAEIARRHGVTDGAVTRWARTHDLWFQGPNNRSPTPYGTIDNAVTAAFREVLGWCPFRDSKDSPAGRALPKGIVDPDPIDRRVA